MSLVGLCYLGGSYAGLFHLFFGSTVANVSIVLVMSVLFVLVDFSFKGEAVVGDEIDRGLHLTQDRFSLLLALFSTSGGTDAMDAFSAVFLNFLQSHSQSGHQYLRLPHVHFSFLVHILSLLCPLFHSSMHVLEERFIQLGKRSSTMFLEDRNSRFPHFFAKGALLEGIGGLGGID